MVVVTAIMALASIAFIISNLSYLDLGESYDSLAPMIDGVTTSVVYLLLAIWLCVIVYLLYFYTRARKAGGARVAGKPSDPRSMVVAIIIILALIGIFSLSGGQLTPPNISIGPPGNGGGGGGEVPGQTQGAASSFILVIFIAVAILGMVVGTRYIRNRPMRESVAIERYEQHQADQLLDQAMKELYAGEDIKAVIVRTYQQMCRLIGGPMLGSALFLTPREFAELAVRRLNWPEGPVLTLTGLFEEAWYSEHQLDEAKKEVALRCLEQLKSGHERSDSQTRTTNPVPGTS